MKPRKKKRRPLFRRIIYWSLSFLAAFYLAIALLLVMLRFVDPPTTAVQIERNAHPRHYHFVSLKQISPDMRHAAIAAEDTRFYQHHGFDWREMGQALEQDLGEGSKRGASTITQQLVRNLFLSTAPNLFRKALEMSMVPMTELILSKDRILELYLNVIEYGPGIYGCDAAARIYFSVPASALTRDQAIKLAEVLPAPLHWKPGQKPKYGARISERMHQAGW